MMCGNELNPANSLGILRPSQKKKVIKDSNKQRERQVLLPGEW